MFKILLSFKYTLCFLVSMKCEICKNKIHETFLNKILGTYVKDAKGKKHAVCFECQKKFKDKGEMIEAL